jgi:hypothetical protein
LTESLSLVLVQNSSEKRIIGFLKFFWVNNSDPGQWPVNISVKTPYSAGAKRVPVTAAGWPVIRILGCGGINLFYFAAVQLRRIAILR